MKLSLFIILSSGLHVEERSLFDAKKLKKTKLN